MKLKLTIFIFFLFFILTLSSAFALDSVTISDNFNDNNFDTSIWGNLSVQYNATMNETNNRLEFYGNSTNSAANAIFAQSHLYTSPTTEGRVTVDMKLLTAFGSNDHGFIALSDHVYQNGWVSAPPSYCGIIFEASNGQFRMLHTYPSAVILATRAYDTLEHRIMISLDRDELSSTYNLFYDGTLIYSDVQQNDCSDAQVNVTLGFYSTDNTQQKYIVFDNFEYVAQILLNGTGSGCVEDSDCESGKCEYGFCALKQGNEECSSDSQCLSGVCTNGKCTKVDIWTGIDESKTQMFGTGTSANNFIALFFIIGIFVTIIFATQGHPAGIIGGGVMAFMLMIFFTIVGWLSVFIMFGGIVTLLIGVVLFVIIMGGSN